MSVTVKVSFSHWCGDSITQLWHIIRLHTVYCLWFMVSIWMGLNGLAHFSLLAASKIIHHSFKNHSFKNQWVQCCYKKAQWKVSLLFWKKRRKVGQYDVIATYIITSSPGHHVAFKNALLFIHSWTLLQNCSYTLDWRSPN